MAFQFEVRHSRARRRGGWPPGTTARVQPPAVAPCSLPRCSRACSNRPGAHPNRPSVPLPRASPARRRVRTTCPRLSLTVPLPFPRPPRPGGSPTATSARVGPRITSRTSRTRRGSPACGSKASSCGPTAEGTTATGVVDASTGSRSTTAPARRCESPRRPRATAPARGTRSRGGRRASGTTWRASGSSCRTRGGDASRRVPTRERGRKTTGNNDDASCPRFTLVAERVHDLSREGDAQREAMWNVEVPEAFKTLEAAHAAG